MRATMLAAAKESEAESAKLQEDIQRLQEEAKTLSRAANAKALAAARIELPKPQDLWQSCELRDAAMEAKKAAEATKHSKLRKVDDAAWQRALESAEVFWNTLDEKRNAAPVLDPDAAEALSVKEAARREAREARVAATEKAKVLAKVTTDAKMAQQKAETLIAAAAAKLGGTSSGQDRVGGFCALFPMGACPFDAYGPEGRCPRGRHGEPPVPHQDEVLARVSRAKMRLIQQKWADAGGRRELVNAWQIRNPRLEVLFRASECDFAAALGHSSDVIDGWHGTSEANVLSIAVSGFDPKRRSGQVFGTGEYFAKNPTVSISYAQGGSFMFLCKLLLGAADLDHTWASGPQYYILKQRDCRIQALPLYVVQFAPSVQRLARWLQALPERGAQQPAGLAVRQRGGLEACEARRDAGMLAASTRHLWIGWLSPDLCHRDDDAVEEDAKEFLQGLAVAQVLPERNGARVGAFVLLQEPLSRSAYEVLRKRPYRGRFRISVDDQQPGNPRCKGKVCPRLTGPSHYCRGWNIRGHHAWHWGCPFEHPDDQRATSGASYSLENLPRESAKVDDIVTELARLVPFYSSDGSCGHPRIISVQRIFNARLERLYEERRGFLEDKHGFVVEKELWHGTSCKALPELLTHGLQPPSDMCPSDECPRSGGRGLCTSLCGADCRHCVEPHCWDRCHMYGLGIYLADLAQKSHRYVRAAPTEVAAAGGAVTGLPTPLRAADRAVAQARPVYSMLRCRVCLGNPYLIEGNLLSGSAMHDLCWCQNPSDMLECSEEWSVARGHDSFFVRGLSGSQKAGLGVYNNEYIVFQPYQVLPLYRVDYTLQ